MEQGSGRKRALPSKTCGDYGGRTRKEKRPCNKPAGHNTAHKGTGLCSTHGGNAGRKPADGRYPKVPAYLQEFARHIGPQLRSMDAEIAIVSEMSAAALAEMAESGCPRWSEALDTFEKLQAAIKTGDAPKMVSSLEALENVLKGGQQRDVFEDRLTSLFERRANLMEKSARIEERSGAVVGAREVYGLAAFVSAFLGEWAQKLQRTDMLHAFLNESAAKGYLPDSRYLGADDPPDRVS